MSRPLLEAVNIGKNYPGVRALNGVSLTVNPGEIIALVGQNGAGKSTLVKILSGRIPAGKYEGQLYLEGREVAFDTVQTAERLGIVAIPQEPTLVPQLKVDENIFLGREPVRFGVLNDLQMRQNAVQVLQQLDPELSPDMIVGELSLAKQQLVEIARALSKQARILILDEPTSSLSLSEVQILFEHLRRLKSNGVSCIYISHRMDEVFEIADRIVVIRDGNKVADAPVGDLSPSDVITHMVGERVEELSGYLGAPGEGILLELQKISVRHPDTGRLVVDNVSFQVAPGEVVGLFGLLGAGRTELMEAIFGVSPGNVEGRMFIKGQPYHPHNPRDAIRHGLAFVTENRHANLLFNLPVHNNLSLLALPGLSRHGILDFDEELALAESFIHALAIKTPAYNAMLHQLSGGNQQKVNVGKWLAADPHILILDEPTRGVDVQAKFEIYRLLQRLAEEGRSVLLVSSEVDEVLAACSRILVFRRGRLVADVPRKDATREQLLNAAMGGHTSYGTARST